MASYARDVLSDNDGSGGDDNYDDDDAGDLVDVNDETDWNDDPDFSAAAIEYGRWAEWYAEPAEMAWNEAEVLDELPAGWESFDGLVERGANPRWMYELMRTGDLAFRRVRGIAYPSVFVDLSGGHPAEIFRTDAPPAMRDP